MRESNEMQLWNFVLKTLSTSGRIALLAVTADEKGSPGKKGFKMALASDGSSKGTIGGGIMEFRMKQEYVGRLQRGGEERIADMRVLVHAPETKRGEPSGLTCAGSQTVCVISLGSEDVAVVRSIAEALAVQRPSHIVISERGLAHESGRLPLHAIFEQSSASHWTYSENAGPEMTVFIVGGGHVGCALSRIVSTLPVYVVVYDERSEMPMFASNDYAHRKISDAYGNVGLYISEPERTFAAVVTSDFSTDAAAVRELLPLRLPYLGIMGVEAKVARIKNTLSEEERAAFDAQLIHAPIGLQIGSGTAEEIAISIAAEMIAVKNRIGGGHTR